MNWITKLSKVTPWWYIFRFTQTRFYEIRKYPNILHTDLLLNENPWKIHEQFGSLIESLTRDHGFEKRLPKLPTISTWNEDQRRLRTQILDNEIEHRITVANALFVQDGFSIRPDYSSAVKNAYDSKLKNLDFQRSGSAAVQYINE